VLRFVLVRLVVQVLAALAAEAGAVGAAEDLVGQRERDRVARPLRQLEVVADHVLRLHLFVIGLFVLVLARVDAQLEDGVAEAAVARPEEPHGEREAEDRARNRARDLEDGRRFLRHRDVSLSAVIEG